MLEVGAKVTVRDENRRFCFICLGCQTEAIEDETGSNYVLQQHSNDFTLLMLFDTLCDCMDTNTKLEDKMRIIEGSVYFCPICKKMLESVKSIQGQIRSLQAKILKTTWTLSGRLLESRAGLPEEEVKVRTSNLPELGIRMRKNVYNRYEAKVRLKRVELSSADPKEHRKSSKEDQQKWRSQFSCFICSSSFVKRFALKRHLLTHNKQPRFECSVCHQIFARGQELRRHSKTTPAGSFPCKKCPLTFKSACALSKHRVVEDHDAKRKSPLDIVVRKYESTDNSQDSETVVPDKPRKKPHQRVYSTNFKVKQLSPNTYSFGDYRFSFIQEGKLYSCLACQYSSDKRVNVVNHIRVNHIYTHQIICEHCGKSFKLPSELRKHQKIHTTDYSYMCEKCGSKFRTSDGLRSHTRQSHPQDTSALFQCQLCPKTYKHKRTLRIHEEEQHPEQMNKSEKLIWDCSSCRKRFSNQRSRYFHMKTHHHPSDARTSTEKQFSCHCGVKFTHNHGLKRHTKLFHASGT